MNQRISNPVLEEIRRRTDIVDLVKSRGVMLKSAGSSFKACCPFHKEKTPSFHVNPGRQFYHCFGCGAHGDVFKFLMQHDGLLFIDAVRTLAEKAGVQLSTETDYAAEMRQSLYTVHAELAAFYRRCLLQSNSGGVARKYLADRNISESVSEQFGIGFAPKQSDTLVKWADKYNFSRELLINAGLLAISNTAQDTESYYDRFRGRLMFPIHDTQGRIVAFSGRVLNPNDHPAKYVNSPETPIFTKSRVLYGLDKARTAIVKHPHREALICEGQIDVIRCHSMGFDTAVASQGTAFTREHVDILKRYADSVVLAYDSDEAGKKAAIRAGVIFLVFGIPVRVVKMPDGEDPDSVLRRSGTEAFRELVDNAASIIDFQIEYMRAHESSPSSVDAVNRISRAVLESLSACTHAVLRAHLMQEAATLLKLPLQAFEDELGKLANHSATASWLEDDPPQVDNSSGDKITEENFTRTVSIDPGEHSLCELIIHYGHEESVADFLAEFLPAYFIRHQFTRRIFSAFLNGREQGIDGLTQFNGDENKEFKIFFEKLVCGHSRIDHSNDKSPLDLARDLVLLLWRRALLEEREKATPERRIEITYLLKQLHHTNTAEWSSCESVINAELRRRVNDGQEFFTDTSTF